MIEVRVRFYERGELSRKAYAYLHTENIAAGSAVVVPAQNWYALGVVQSCRAHDPSRYKFELKSVHSVLKL